MAEGTLSPFIGMAATMAMGILVFILGFFMRKKYKNRVQMCTAQTDGVVSNIVRKITTDTDENGKIKKSYVYYPDFTYTVDGTRITMTASGRSHTGFKKGQAVTIFYNPNNVEEYYVPQDKSTAWSGFIIMAVGVVFFVVSLIIPFFN